MRRHRPAAAAKSLGAVAKAAAVKVPAAAVRPPEPKDDQMVEALTLVLAKFATTATLCTYADEASTVSHAKLHVSGARGVIANSNLLRSLYRLQTRLSFKKLVVRQALQAVFATKCETAGSWACLMSTHAKDDWVQTIERRIRNMCRCVQQGRIKSPKAAWLKRLGLGAPCDAGQEISGGEEGGTYAKHKEEDGGENAEEEEEEAEQEEDVETEAKEEDAEQEEEDDDANLGGSELPCGSAPKKHTASSSAYGRDVWSYRFSRELLLPYKFQGKNDDPAQRDVGLPIKVGAACKDDECVLAKWPCGHEVCSNVGEV